MLVNHVHLNIKTKLFNLNRQLQQQKVVFIDLITSNLSFLDFRKELKKYIYYFLILKFFDQYQAEKSVSKLFVLIKACFLISTLKFNNWE